MRVFTAATSCSAARPAIIPRGRTLPHRRAVGRLISEAERRLPRRLMTPKEFNLLKGSAVVKKGARPFQMNAKAGGQLLRAARQPALISATVNQSPRSISSACRTNGPSPPRGRPTRIPARLLAGLDLEQPLRRLRRPAADLLLQLAPRRGVIVSPAPTWPAADESHTPGKDPSASSACAKHLAGGDWRPAGARAMTSLSRCTRAAPSWPVTRSCSSPRRRVCRDSGPRFDERGGPAKSSRLRSPCPSSRRASPWPRRLYLALDLEAEHRCQSGGAVAGSATLPPLTVSGVCAGSASR